MSTTKNAPTDPPAGGKKGGTMFPRISLKEAAPYAKKLVAKTHVSAQPQAAILSGVFGVTSSSSVGKIKASALKQYGLLEGPAASYSASKLAKKLDTSTGEERSDLLRKACLNPRVFNSIYETFHGDEVSVARIRQRASELKVHPDKLDDLADVFIESVEFAGLGTRAGDSVNLVAIHDMSPDVQQGASDETEDADNSESDTNDEIRRPDDDSEGSQGQASGRSIVHVNVTLDSSMDTEKLQKQLEILRKFGAI